MGLSIQKKMVIGHTKQSTASNKNFIQAKSTWDIKHSMQWEELMVIILHNHDSETFFYLLTDDFYNCYFREKNQYRIYNTLILKLYTHK